MTVRLSAQRGSLRSFVVFCLVVSFLIVGNGALSAFAGACPMSKAADPAGKEMLSHGCCCEERQAGQAASCADLKARYASDWSTQAAFSLPRSAIGASMGLGPAFSLPTPSVLPAGTDRPGIPLRSRTVYLANLSLLC